MDKNRKIILCTGILFLIFSLMFLSLFIVSISIYNESNNLKYSDLIYMECTVDDFRESGNREDGYLFYIFVIEEKKDIRVNNLLTENNVIEELRTLKNGDIIYCYVKEGKSFYEAVEIKGNNMILSLEQYKQIMQEQGIAGLIIFPIVFCVTFGIGIYSIIVVSKNRRKEYV